MLGLLADQVSLAIENARLFDDTRKAIAESEMINRNAVREAWSRLPEEQKLLGYRYNITGAAPLYNQIELADLESHKPFSEGSSSNSAIVPIELRGVSIGNLIVHSASDESWTKDQLDMIQAVAERVALSAENARLFDETTARAERERLLSEITSKIRSQNDPQAMIRTAVDELRSALGATHVEIIPQTAKAVGKGEV
jgi:GAF domain-containing protein